MSEPPRELLGTRVRLRPPALTDVDRIFRWYQDPELSAPFDRFSVDTLDGLVRAIQEAPSDPNSLAPRFVVEARDCPRVVPACLLRRSHSTVKTQFSAIFDCSGTAADGFYASRCMPRSRVPCSHF